MTPSPSLNPQKLPKIYQSLLVPVGPQWTEQADSMFSQPCPAHEEPLLQLVPYAGKTVLLAHFSSVIQQELSKACEIIINDIKHGILSFGLRLNTIKTKVDGTVVRVNQNTRILLSFRGSWKMAPQK